MGSHSLTRRHGRQDGAFENAAFFRAHNYTRVPRLVQWMVTLDCPLKCSHCLAAQECVQRTPDMPLTQAEGLIAEVAELGVEEFLLTGGEPLSRPDFPEIVRLLRSYGVRWSLNTAAMPDNAARAAIEEWPPCFVAVSLDGPEQLHDKFRGRNGAYGEALASIAYFARLVPGCVAAGTTVTAANFGYLGQTFGIVVESGASEWGLHLMVPEGRASKRPDLALTGAQLRELLRFAATKRAHFPVNMADEIGYCGFWEPLVRRQPFFCGAGRSHCVILPDGEVVPCTTLDRAASAGNVLRMPLREIWEHGFAELRNWRREGSCARCAYASACEGGCWLQRRHGTQCFKDAWESPVDVGKTGRAALLVLALGLPATAATAEEARPETKPGLTDLVGLGGSPAPGAWGRRSELAGIGSNPFSADEEKQMLLERAIMRYYTSGERISVEGETALRKQMGDDPGLTFVLLLANGECAKDLQELSGQVKNALKSEQHSLSLVCFCWRAVAEWSLDGGLPERRSAAERQLLRELLVKLDETGSAWWKETLQKKLDPFLRPARDGRGSFGSKAGPSWRRVLAYRTGGERFAAAVAEATGKIHDFGEGMRLTFESGVDLKRMRRGREIPAAGELGVFDVLIAPDKEGADPVVITIATGQAKMRMTLPADEMTYADVLRACYEQNTGEIEKFDKVSLGQAYTPQPPPVLLPLWRQQLEDAQGKTPPPPDAARWRRGLANMWLF